ncbi:MAG: YifB family Mg chelatase-like AAA ATPase [Coriobacteriia bacterium]|nr:YifB family Mg chelatase-like AAA ATPase [Coriobacteriia bacterium]MBN2822771.1 YifB family Mg chelatase-like AAA ATPase [Coriobacteriia bacterium]
MQATVMTATLRGVDALPVEVQADVTSGLPMFGIVGLGDAAVQEAKERVRSAVRAAGLEFPNARVIINLAPAPLRKHGTGFDLPIALAILAATRQIPLSVIEGSTAVGELALDGSVRAVPGMLAHAYAASRSGLDLLGPSAAMSAAAVVGCVRCRVVDHVTTLRRGEIDPQYPCCDITMEADGRPDLADVAGHHAAKRALEIAAAGGHNLLLVGPPGSGKTMLARRLGGILPPLHDDERMTTALVHSVAGIDERPALAGIRPFRAPHHSTSTVGLIGGGTPPRPGEVSLAHNGVLFLDELAEFGPATLQAMRQPMEDGTISLVRADGRVRYPAAFTLIGAMNPCPCGYLGDAEHRCTCSQPMIDRYTARIGGPLLDRIDMRIRVDRIDPGKILRDDCQDEPSAEIAQRVISAIAFAGSRPPTRTLSGARLLEACRPQRAARSTLEALARTVGMSGRAVTRTLRVARTIADLEGHDSVGCDHILEAAGYRMSDVR